MGSLGPCGNHHTRWNVRGATVRPNRCRPHPLRKLLRVCNKELDYCFQAKIFSTLLTLRSTLDSWFKRRRAHLRALSRSLLPVGSRKTGPRPQISPRAEGLAREKNRLCVMSPISDWLLPGTTSPWSTIGRMVRLIRFHSSFSRKAAARAAGSGRACDPTRVTVAAVVIELQRHADQRRDAVGQLFVVAFLRARGKTGLNLKLPPSESGYERDEYAKGQRSDREQPHQRASVRLIGDAQAELERAGQVEAVAAQKAIRESRAEQCQATDRQAREGAQRDASRCQGRQAPARDAPRSTTEEAIEQVVHVLVEVRGTQREGVELR